MVGLRCNGPFFGSRGCGIGLATIMRDGFAGFQGGNLTTAPTRVSGDMLRISVDGGSGVRVGIVGDADYSVEMCDPIVGRRVDAVISWRGQSNLSKFTNGAVSLEFVIPADATVFAYSM